MKILLISPYHAKSHAAWCDGLIENMPEHDWTLLTLPPRYFAWRMRGNALSLHSEYSDALHRKYDMLLVTSMTDLAGLRGLVPSLANTPAYVYFHENQFAYPPSEAKQPPIDLQMVSILSVAAADGIAFNSEWNQTSMKTGAGELLKKLPDYVPRKAIINKLEGAQILPVPLSTFGATAPRNTAPTKHLIWNHRWEYDKTPSGLFDLLEACADEHLKVSVVGQQFRTQPKVFTKISQLLNAKNQLEQGAWGYIDDESEYRALLASGDIVLSTSVHDFQGLAIMEAVQAGCVPLLPNRLCYPEFFNSDYLFDGAGAEKLKHWLREGLPKVPSVRCLEWPALKVRYQDWLQSAL